MAGRSGRKITFSTCGTCLLPVQIRFEMPPKKKGCKYPADNFCMGDVITKRLRWRRFDLIGRNFLIRHLIGTGLLLNDSPENSATAGPPCGVARTPRCHIIRSRANKKCTFSRKTVRSSPVFLLQLFNATSGRTSETSKRFLRKFCVDCICLLYI